MNLAALGGKGSKALGAALALLLAASAGAQASSHALRKPHVSKISLLYVVNAGAGTLTPQPGHPGRFTLTLGRLESRAVWFSDRPTRRSGAFPTSALAAAWKGFGFTSQPPNAAVDYTDPARGPGHAVILELTNPRYHHGALSFTARIIDPTTITSGNLAGHAHHADRTPPRTLISPALFIDDTTAPMIGICIIQPYTDCGGQDLAGANLQGANLTGANLEFANLTGAFGRVNLEDANLNSATLTDAEFLSSNLSNANLSGAELLRVQLPQVNLSGATLFGADLTDGWLFQANLTDAFLFGATLSNTDLSGAVFCNTTMPNGQVFIPACP